MQSGSLSQSKISHLISEGVHKGGFTLPHVIFELPITGGHRDVLIALFKIQHDFITQCRKHNGWFFANMKAIAYLAKRSQKTVQRAKWFFKATGIIDYRVAIWQKEKSTQYRILIDDFYLADLLIDGVNQTDNKSNGY